MEIVPARLQEYESPLDKGIEEAVHILRDGNIETYESCEGGDGHAYPEPTIRFHGDRSEGFRALAVALQHDLPVSALRRNWSILDGEPVGPTWEMTFWIPKIIYAAVDQPAPPTVTQSKS